MGEALAREGVSVAKLTVSSVKAIPTAAKTIPLFDAKRLNFINLTPNAKLAQ
ncbi:MAG: hypothetical protein AB1589_04015 [Cyanobacteriota bacterium]